jgi:Outer membrane protein beta-barrel domain
MGSLSRRALNLGLVALFFLPAGLAAQMTVGIGGGIVSATLTGDDTEELSSKIGISLNGWLAIPINEKLSFVPGAAFIQKGFDASDDDASLTLSYIEFPLLVSAALAGEEGSTGFHVFGGPTIAFEASCSFESDGNSEDCGEDDNRRKVDVGALVGAGASIPAGERLTVFINAGVEFGLLNLLTEDDADTARNRALFLSAGVAFPVGG